MGDKGKPLRSGDKEMSTNKPIYMGRPESRILTYRQIRRPKITYIQTGKKDTCMNKLIRAQTRQKYVLAAEYVHKNLYAHRRGRNMYSPHNT